MVYFEKLDPQAQKALQQRAEEIFSNLPERVKESVGKGVCLKNTAEILAFVNNGKPSYFKKLIEDYEKDSGNDQPPRSGFTKG